MALPVLVHALKISVLQQVRRLGKLGSSIAAHNETGPASAKSPDSTTQTIRKNCQAAGDLLAIAGLNRNALAPLGATTRKYRLTALGLHAATETVLLGTFAAVGLECALGHGKTALL